MCAGGNGYPPLPLHNSENDGVFVTTLGHSGMLDITFVQEYIPASIEVISLEADGAATSPDSKERSIVAGLVMAFDSGEARYMGLQDVVANDFTGKMQARALSDLHRTKTALIKVEARWLKETTTRYRVELLFLGRKASAPWSLSCMRSRLYPPKTYQVSTS